jgi:hypothetical protein
VPTLPQREKNDTLLSPAYQRARKSWGPMLRIAICAAIFGEKIGFFLRKNFVIIVLITKTSCIFV